MLLRIKGASKEVSSRMASANLARSTLISTVRSVLIVSNASNAKKGTLGSIGSVSHVRIGSAGSVNLAQPVVAPFVQKASL